MRRKLGDFKTATMDFETDPFKAGRIPEPFAGAFYTEGLYFSTWGKNCVPELMERIAELPDKYVIYVHNGGRFDFHFLFDYIEEPVFIVNAKLIEFSMGVTSKGAHHVVRDSLAIIPVPLDAYRKSEIDYAKFERKRRERHRQEIETYLHSDCKNLFEIVSRFRERFESKGEIPITVGSCAMKELRKLHPIERMTEGQDALFRPYYFGGRTQAFRAGVLKGPWKIYDVNSAYPAAMQNWRHPAGCEFETRDDITIWPKPSIALPPVFFAEFDGVNRGALPARIIETYEENGETLQRSEKTDFELPRGRFFACSHELIPALRAGMVEIERLRAVHLPARTQSFAAFVQHWYREKAQAKLRGDKAGELFAKFMLNSCYGKFGQNPRNYKSYALLRDPFKDGKLLKLGYLPETRLRADLELWSRPSKVHAMSFFDVSIAASITSAARSIMLQGLADAIDPIYCDTDSVICRRFTGEIDPVKLGAWKFEGTAQFAAIAGRKLYCLFNRNGRRIVPVKWASKGGDLDPHEIIAIARGGQIEKMNEFPTFSLRSGIHFQSRTFRRTML
jgi:hypothetical protein